VESAGIRTPREFDIGAGYEQTSSFNSTLYSKLNSPSHDGLASHSSVIASRECFDVGREGNSIVSRKRKHQWTATLVPWGTLTANPNHRHFGKTREQRIDVAIAIIRQTLVGWLADFTVVEMPEVHLV
jgi:hypothetical protein